MSVNANSLLTAAAVTAAVFVMVFLLPWLDRRICGRLGLNLTGGLSSHPQAARLLKLRRWILYGLFGLYLLAVAWLVFFSRHAQTQYLVHVALFEDLRRSVVADFGFLDFLAVLWQSGAKEALRHIHVVNPADILQVYMNIMLFVPMGYLLPYLFAWQRARVHVRPVCTCFLISFVIENVQLITRRGFYDMDDLVSNTLGGLAGQLLFISVAYVVTHPDWRKELKAYRRWKRNARTRTLYPFAKRLSLSRTTLLATNEEQVWDFYVMKLGFRLLKQLVPMDSAETQMLLGMGKSQIEFRCVNQPRRLEAQALTISVRRLTPVIERLRMNGIAPGPVTTDPYTGQRCIQFTGPDDVTVTILASV